MTYLTAVLLGLLQGITEFLPISSSGHLAIMQNLFHIEGADLIFDVLLHVGTLLPILLMFRRELGGVRRGLLGMMGTGHNRGRRTIRARRDHRRAVFFLIGTLPLLLGLLLKGAAEKMMENSVFVGFMLLLTGAVLHISGKASNGEKTEEQASLLDVFLVGVSQVASVLPGLSRSGLTISVGRMRGLSMAYAVRLSFVLSVPAVLGAALLSLIEAVQMGFDTSLLPMYLLGMLAAAISGYFSIRLLRWMTRKGGLSGFAYYCWGAGIVSLMLSLVA